jgi:hypothetical protein
MKHTRTKREKLLLAAVVLHIFKIILISGFTTAGVIYITSLLLGCSGGQPALDVGDALYQELAEGCEPGALTCRENSLFICNASKRWEPTLNCGEYNPVHNCCEHDGEPGCYRPENCEVTP